MMLSPSRTSGDEERLAYRSRAIRQTRVPIRVIGQKDAADNVDFIPSKLSLEDLQPAGVRSSEPVSSTPSNFNRVIEYPRRLSAPA